MNLVALVQGIVSWSLDLSFEADFINFVLLAALALISPSSPELEFRRIPEAAGVFSSLQVSITVENLRKNSRTVLKQRTKSSHVLQLPDERL